MADVIAKLAAAEAALEYAGAALREGTGRGAREQGGAMSPRSSRAPPTPTAADVGDEASLGAAIDGLLLAAPTAESG